MVEFQTLYNGILYKNYSRRAVCFFTRENKSRSSMFIYTRALIYKRPDLHQALSATAGQFCASDQSNEKGQMPDGAGMFSECGQIPGVRPGVDDRSWN